MEIREAYSEKDLEKGLTYRLTGERVNAKATYLGSNEKKVHRFIHNFRGVPLLWTASEIDFIGGKVYIPETAEVQRDFNYGGQI